MTGTDDRMFMDEYCSGLLPDLLGQCNVEAAKVKAIVDDVRRRAESFVALDEATQRIITAPFFEDVAAYKPYEAPTFVKAAVAVTVRNSLLEEVHAGDLVQSGGLTVITEMAAQPLVLLMLAARTTTNTPPMGSPFSDLYAPYPRAWAAMQALADGFKSATGGRTASRSVTAPIPEFPSDIQVETRPMSTTSNEVVIENALAETFNEYLVNQLREVIESGSVFFVPSLSRISRSSAKMLRVVELLLAHQVPILTTNYLIRSRDIWIRQGGLIAPDIDDIHSSLQNESGLVGTHRKITQGVRASLQQRTE